MQAMRSALNLRLTIVVALVAVGVLTWAPIANADPDDCSGYTCEDGGDVIIHPQEPEAGGGSVSTGVSTSGPAVCTHGREEIPCSSPDGLWNSAYGCYLRLAPGGGPPPPAAGNPNGAWYWCISLGDTNTVRTIWLDNPPEQLPSPAELAQEALERMDLEPIDIGIVPEDEPGRIGLVGMPVWMWVQDPAANIVGPMTESATAGSLTVTATARVDSIVWTMGDGNTVTCTTDGTPYRNQFGDSDSPDCGHRYTTTSWDQRGHKFTVTATTQWVVEWAGGRQSGTILIDHTAETQIRVGEMQVLTQ